MKLLFDQNLAPSLVGHLGDHFPGSQHVSQCGLGDASDIGMWEYARENGFASFPRMPISLNCRPFAAHRRKLFG
ncbi:MAG: DUF5615 family PIN-like protein [Thermoanaerobaculia bacterium]